MKAKIYQNGNVKLLPIYLDTIGYNKKQERVVRPAGYPSHQIFMVNNGTGLLQVDGKKYFLEENDIFFIQADIPHQYFGYDNDFTTSFLGFSGNGCDGVFKYYSLLGYGVYKGKFSKMLEAEIKSLYSSIDTIQAIPTLCAKTFNLVTLFFETAVKQDISLPEQAYNYLLSNYRNEIALEDILLHCKCSKSTLYKEFKEKYKKSPFEVLITIRLEYANSMLQYMPNAKLKDISKSCGFNDVSYFCKQYKKMYHSSPKNRPLTSH